MKKIIILMSVVGLIFFTSCEGPEGIPGEEGLSAEAFEIKNVNLSRVASNEYNFRSTFQFEIGGNLFDDETVLVYRLSGLVNSNTPVWQLIPRTLYFDNGAELDYDYDFSKVDFVISARGTYNLLNTSEFINQQTFRVVIISSNLSSSVNKNNYFEVMNALNINERQIQKINF